MKDFFLILDKDEIDASINVSIDRMFGEQWYVYSYIS